MPDTLPGYLTDVDESIDSANIDKSAEIGQVADHAWIFVANFNGVPDLAFTFLALLLKQHTPGTGDPHASAIGVELGHQDVEFLIPVGLKVIDDRKFELGPVDVNINGLVSGDYAVTDHIDHLD